MEDLGALLADGDAFSVDPDRAGFTVSYDDVLAHEYADLVATSASAIAAVPGVSDVIHEDREILLVRADREVTARQVTAALTAFWRDAARRPQPWQEILKGLAAAAAPTLKAAGFRKQALRWNRETTPGFVQIIELSRVEAGDDYVGSVDVGLYDDEVARLRHPGDRPKFLQEMHGQVRRDMGTFELTTDAAALLRIIEDEVLPYLEAHRSRHDLLDADSLNLIDRAIVLSLDGDAAAAHEILQQRFDATSARAHILQVAARLGLPPLATGVDPSRSRAEEAFLPRWIEGVAPALDRFRQTLAAHGVDPTDLDGSPHSLEHLRPLRWRPVVSHLQDADPPTAASPYMQLPRGVWSHFGRGAIGEVVPHPAVKQLAEDLAAYLGTVLLGAAPGAAWSLLSTGFGLQPAIDVPGRREPAAVMKVAVEYTTAAFRPLTPEQERLFQRYQPLRADVDRWLREADRPPASAATRRRWPFRRG